MTDTDRCFTLELVTPGGLAARVTCDSVRLTLADGQRGSGGGSYGVRKGHAPAVFLLADGQTVALLDGEEVFSARTGEGFAGMAEDTLTVTVCRTGTGDRMDHH